MTAKLRPFVATIALAAISLLFAPPAGALPEIVATIPTGDTPMGVAVDHSTNRIFVVEMYSHDVRVINGANNAVLTTFGQGLLGFPREIAIDEARRIAWITTAMGNVFAYNVDTYTHITNFPAGDYPFPVGVDQSRSRVYVGDLNGGTVKVIDEVQMKVIASIPVGSKPRSLAVNSANGRVYVVNGESETVSVISETSLSVVKTVPVTSPWAIGVDETTGRYYVADEWDSLLVTFDGATDQRIAAPLVGLSKDQACCINHVAIDPVLHRAYVPGSNIYVAMVNTETNTYMAQLRTSGISPSNIAINSDTQLLYIVDPNANLVTVIHEDAHADETPPTTSVALSGGQIIDGKRWAVFQWNFTLTCTDDGDGCLRSEYKIDDGDVHTYYGSQYGGPSISGEGLHTIWYRSVDAGGNVEEWRSIDAGIDRTPPVTIAHTTASNPVDGGWTRGTWDVALSCTDKSAGYPPVGIGCASVTYELDDAGPKTYSGAFTISAEGDHTVLYYATDRLGNTEPTRAVHVGIDRTVPVTSSAKQSDVPVNKDWSSGTWQITLSCADPLKGAPKGASGCASTTTTLDNGAPSLYSGSLFVETEGRHTLGFSSTDRAGNIATARSQTLLIDHTAPVGTMSTPNGAIFVATILPVQLVASAEDPALRDGSVGSGVDSLCFETYALMATGDRQYVDCFDATFQAGYWRAQPTLPAGQYETRPRPADVATNRGSGAPVGFTALGLP